MQGRGPGTCRDRPFYAYETGQFLLELSHLFALGDMPGVGEAIYRDLLDWNVRLSAAFTAAEQAYAVIPQYKGKKGHPLLLSAQMRTRILKTDVSKTLRDVLAEVPTVIVPADEPGILHDIDTPADYHSWSPGRDSAGDSR